MDYKELYKKLDKLSEKKVDELLGIMDIGINMTDGGAVDKSEKIDTLSTLPPKKVLKALKKLKS